jgi:tripartite-type tricarboxylate transporter receptor subunit TctC
MINHPTRRDVLRRGAAVLAAGLPKPAIAEASWPKRPIRILCGFAPGGLVDVFARAYGEYISQKIGQPIVVENKTGASGAIAAVQAKSALPDGYTLMFTIATTMIMNKALFKTLPYDPDKDFTLIAWASTGHLPMIVHKSVSATNLKEFADYARTHTVSLGTYGVGSYSHMAVEALNRHYGLKIEPVHYRGESLMWQDVASGAVQGGNGTFAAAESILQSGNGRAIAVPTRVRMKKLPDVPTFYEQGVTDRAFLLQGWIGLVGPAGLPPQIVQRLSDLMVEAGHSERIRKILDIFGIDDAAHDHISFEKIVAEEGPIWIDEIKSLNIEPQ